MHWPLSERRRLLLAIAMLWLLGLAGCGKRLYPVHGTVTLEDGTPVSRGMVVMERTEGGEAITARGEIQADGRFQLSTHKPGDGVPPGRYKVLINPLDLSDVPDEKKDLPFDIKYLKFETSELEYEVKAESNDFPIRVIRPRKGRP